MPYLGRMSIWTDTGVIPRFTMGDRLRKAREMTGLDQTAFAAELGVSRQTVSNYELDNTKPRRLALRAWSLRTGVPIEWLEAGQTPKPHPGGPDGASELCATKDSNLEPTDYRLADVVRLVAS